MIDTIEMDLEERKDLLYDIRDGKVKYEDVIWEHPVEHRVGNGLFGEWEVAYFSHLREFIKSDIAHKIMESNNERSVFKK